MEINNQPQVQPQEPEKIRRRRNITTEAPTTSTRSAGNSIDVGTGFLVSAIFVDGKIKYKTQRDAFVDLENNSMTKNMLKKLNAHYIESEDKKSIFVIGDEALNLANFFNRELRRPLSKGVLSTREKESLSMIKLILHELVGDPIVQNEKLFFSVPASPIDEDFNSIYHENVLKSFLDSFGYDSEALNEAFAIVLSELEDEDYIGMAVSVGAGMSNICLSYLGVADKNLQFSVARAGDWVDINSGGAVGLKASRMTMVKEAGVDLLNPKTREETAIKIYYENLIKYICSAIEKKYNSVENIPNFPDPITIVLSGGTSKAINFDKIFEKEIMTKTLPFKIKQIKRASDPLNAVAKGCLLNAIDHSQK